MHEKQKLLFLRAIQKGRLAHAYALVGARGIGKTAFALDLARHLGADPVLDVFVLGQENSISVEEVRSLHARLALAPAGKSKAAVIKADLLTTEAASCLLKVLEEPPEHSYIFLTTANFYSLLPTIASRVQKVMFSGQRPWNEPEFSNYYEILNSGSLAARLLTAEKLADEENSQARNFIEFSMQKFCAAPETPKLGSKLLTALSDLESNVNLKLALDNLFLN